ncbi:helix-turn-helix transcriptional regulator [Sphingomonas rhizophila]|uniref:Helix-turn-helix transcriptional regulator n=2 Tax=Sphingomonas rhizophila TaxID=2071607 RepID=A0A7G9S9I2_9SPHN|nr:helix-turn-helix transcriptional regulator [Sphingomonas rhizophila]
MPSAATRFSPVMDRAEDAAQRVARLSPGQRECLALVNQHLSSKEIAAQLGISPHTVDQRIRQALQVLHVERRAEAARLLAAHDGVSEPYQRLIHQPPYIDPAADSPQIDGAVGHQIRHADRTGGTNPA